MEKKSIIIFGKGPSVLKCNREFVDQFEETAILNYPVLNDFFYNLIKDRKIKYHFCNCGSYDNRYTNKINEKLKIERIYNTNSSNNYKNFLKNNSIFSKENFRESILSFFKKNYDLDPSTGIICIKYILDLKIYDKIGLVGFDNFKKGEQTYYFKPSEYGKEAKRLVNFNYKGNIIIQKNGIFNITSGHDPEKSKKYIEDCIEKNKNIEFKIISNEKYLNKI